MAWHKGDKWPRLGRKNPVLHLTVKGKKAHVRGARAKELVARIQAGGPHGVRFRQATADITDRWRIREMLQRGLVKAVNAPVTRAEVVQLPIPRKMLQELQLLLRRTA